MPFVNLLNQMALTKSVDQNQANLINLYLVENKDLDKYNQESQGPHAYSAYPTPGATLFSAGSTNLRAVYSQHGVTYGIDGNNFFSVASNGTRTSLGTLNTSSGWAKIKGISQELLIADSTNLYYFKILTNAFGQPLNTNYIFSASVTAAGSGYTAPTAVITDSTGTGATATVQTNGGQVSGVTITLPGSGYSSTPIITINDSTGINATAVLTVATSSVPTTIQDIECQDEFGLVLQGSSQVWYASSISDLTTFPVLSFASTTGNQNYNQAIISLHRELYIFGTQTTEVWDNLGQANFTFGRNQNAFIEYGCGATGSVAKTNNTVYWLAQSQTGGFRVMQMVGYTPTTVSTRAIDYQISTYTTVSDAIGFTYEQEGHEFYVIKFPTAGVCWVYDISTNMWHQRSSSGTAWLPTSYSFNYGKNLVGSSSGNMYYLDMSNNTESGVAITRTLQTPPFYNLGALQVVDRLQIDFDNGPGSNLANWNLYVSRDGGRTYGTAKPAYPQQDSNGMWRVYWPRLGSGRGMTFRLTTSYNMQTIILGAWGTLR